MIENRMWDPLHECMDPEKRRELQLRRLKMTVARCYALQAPYRAKMEEAGVKPEDIRTLEDIRYLPFVTKKDLRDHYPKGFFAADPEDIVRIHATSGTTGSPVIMGYTRKDLDTWQQSLARGLVSLGVDQSSVVQISFGYGMFTGGLGVHDGAQRVGALVIPTSGGNTHRQVQLMHDMGTTHLCCTPSYALYLAEVIEAGEYPQEKFKLQVGVFGAEAWSEDMRAELERRLHIRARDIYGLTEVTGPGVACQCLNGAGLHIQEDYFYPEIVDPETLEPLPDGQVGELVFSTICKEGVPLLRYRTRDLTSLIREKCSCGRTTVRMNRIMGRTDDMLIIRGVNVFPTQIESALLNLGMEPNYMIEVDRINNLDRLAVQVELSEANFSDEVRQIENFQHRVCREIENIIGINCQVKICEPHSLPRFEGKAKRVIDHRKEQK